MVDSAPISTTEGVVEVEVEEEEAAAVAGTVASAARATTTATMVAAPLGLAVAAAAAASVTLRRVKTSTSTMPAMTMIASPPHLYRVHMPHPSAEARPRHQLLRLAPRRYKKKIYLVASTTPCRHRRRQRTKLCLPQSVLMVRYTVPSTFVAADDFRR